MILNEELWYEPCFPTYDELHRIGVSWSFLAEKCNFDVRTLRKRKSDVVFEDSFYASNNETEWVNDVMERCDKLVEAYVDQDKRRIKGLGEDVKSMWQKKRPLFELGLKDYCCIQAMDISVATQRMKEWNEKQSEKTNALLKKIKPLYEVLSLDTKKSLVYCFDAYITLFDCPIFPFVHYLSVNAKKIILNELNHRSFTGKDLLSVLQHNSNAIGSVNKLLNYCSSFDRGGDIEIWQKFTEKMKPLGHEYYLKMSAAIQCNIIQSIDQTELLIYLAYYVLLITTRWPHMSEWVLRIKGMLSEDSIAALEQYQQLQKH